MSREGGNIIMGGLSTIALDFLFFDGMCDGVLGNKGLAAILTFSNGAINASHVNIVVKSGVVCVDRTEVIRAHNQYLLNLIQDRVA